MSAAMRALFPPIDLRRLRFRGGWTGLPLFVLMALVYPTSLQQAAWVEITAPFVPIALAGIAVGTLAGNGRLRPSRVAMVGAIAGALVVMVATISAVPGSSFHERAVALGVDVNTWLTQVLAGEAGRGQSVFTLFLGGTVWSSTFIGAFVLARTGQVREAVLLSGACLTLNVSLALTPLLLDLVIFTLCALLLMLRMHIAVLQERWERQNIQPSGEMDWRVLRGGLTWTTVLVIMALITPRVGAAETLDGAFNVFNGPYQHVEVQWQRFFAGVSGPSRIRGVDFADAIRLGQSPNLSNGVVMTVDSSQGQFWRAITYDFYTGQGWQSTDSGRVTSVTPNTFRDRVPLTVTIKVDEPLGGRLFAPAEPAKVSIPAQFIVGADSSFSSGIHALEQPQPGLTYTVTSYVSTADKQSLRNAPTTIPSAVAQKYLQIPSNLPARVGQLAQKTVAGKTNEYDKADAIESYLRTNYHYAPVVRPPPPGEDPVDFFLFHLKEDFCEYFASSMVMMLREVGVPARLVEGFASGTLDTATGEYVVKQSDAHAWVEAYFPTYGWIQFEPTPSQPPFARPDQPAVGAAAGTDTSGAPDAGQNPDDRLSKLDQQAGGVAGSGSSSSGSLPVDPRPALGAIAAILLAMLAFVARFEWRFRGLTAVEAAWGKASLLAAYVGHPSRASDTTYEYADSLGRAVPEVAAPMRVIADARVRERYAPLPIDDEVRQRAEDAWWMVARELVSLVPRRVLAFVAHLVPQR